MISRRKFLYGLSSSSLIPFWMNRNAHAQPNSVRRVLFFYFPDGVPGKSFDGEPSRWHCSGSEHSPILSPLMEELRSFTNQLIFLNGITMDPHGVVQNQHIPGAQRLLTGGGDRSIDSLLGTYRSTKPWANIYLGVQCSQNPPAPAQFLSSPLPGVYTPPLENPIEAFCEIFHHSTANSSCYSFTAEDLSLIDQSIADLERFRNTLPNRESTKLEYHLESLDQLRRRFSYVYSNQGLPSLSDNLFMEELHNPIAFPYILKAQSDIMISAMEMGLTDVGFIQCSRHTSPLSMGNFSEAIPSLEWRISSHDASHYGKPSDFSNLRFQIYFEQRRWFVQQYRYLLQELHSRREDDGTMLDHTLVVAMSEISDGNTHSLDNMPFLLAGGGLRGGRVLNYDDVSHCDLWISIAKAMGHDLEGFGQHSSGILPGLL